MRPAAIASPIDLPVECQPAAVLARFESVVDKLRNCIVCEGWNLDEARLQQFTPKTR
jgi:hypothetical protein